MNVKWESARRLFQVLGVTLSWAFTSLLFVIFYTAVFNPYNQVLIDVNAYGEMGVEIFIFGLVWIALTLNMLLIWKSKEHEESR